MPQRQYPIIREAPRWTQRIDTWLFEGDYPPADWLPWLFRTVPLTLVLTWHWPKLFAVAVLLLLGWMLLKYRERRHLARLQWCHANQICTECGYDLRATPERCPECGKKTDGPSSIA